MSAEAWQTHTIIEMDMGVIHVCSEAGGESTNAKCQRLDSSNIYMHIVRLLLAHDEAVRQVASPTLK